MLWKRFGVTLDAPVQMGQVAIPNVLGLGSDVIVTRNVDSKCGHGVLRPGNGNACQSSWIPLKSN